MFYFNFKFERVHCQLYIDRLGAKHCEALALGKRSIAGGDVCWHLRFVGFLHFFMVFIFIFSGRSICPGTATCKRSRENLNFFVSLTVLGIFFLPVYVPW